MTGTTSEIALTCPRCGGEVQTQWSYCPFCSMALEVPAGEQATLSDRIRYIRRESERVGRRQMVYKWILSVSVVVTVLLIVGGGIILFHPAFVPALFQPLEPLVVETTARAAGNPAEMPAPLVTGIEWVKIPAGTFTYGRPERKPPVEVELEAFEIMKYEVTNQQWEDYLWGERKRLERGGQFNESVPRTWDWNPKSGEFPRVPFGLHDKPVVYITWYQANDFCRNWLHRKVKCKEAFLPTSAQWEMAARGTEDVRRYPWGDEPTLIRGDVPVLRCNVRETGLRRPMDVTAFPQDRSFYGVYGMGGNVAEFVGNPEWNAMAYKGGSFEDPVVDAQIHIETPIPPRSSFSWSFVGFRAARPAQE